MNRVVPEDSSVLGSSRKPRLLFVVNADWVFLYFRLPLARAARDAGFEIVVAAADTGKSGQILREGFDFVPIPLSRRGMNPLREPRSVVFLRGLYRRLRPDLIQHVTIKPVLYGSLATRLLGRDIAVVNIISGLGYAFSSAKRAHVIRPLVKALYRLALRRPRSRTIFQNPDDLETFVDMRLVRREQAVLILGSGVDCTRFRAAPEPEGKPIVMLPSRMLWDKGVKEYVEAARHIRQAGERARFVLVGGADPGNPMGIPVEQLEAWVREGIVEWWEHCDDMPQVLSSANLIVLPSYREGLPKVLLEAAASARAIVATDVPGCREIVRHGANGLLVLPRDSTALARAVRTLLESPEQRERFGEVGRQIAVTEFAEEIVVEQTLDLYRKLLGTKWPRKDAERALP